MLSNKARTRRTGSPPRPVWAQMKGCAGGVAQQPVHRHGIHMRQHARRLTGQLHQRNGRRPIGVGAVVEMEFTQAAKGARPGCRPGADPAPCGGCCRRRTSCRSQPWLQVEPDEGTHCAPGVATRRSVPSLGRLLTSAPCTPARFMRASVLRRVGLLGVVVVVQVGVEYRPP